MSNQLLSRNHKDRHLKPAPKRFIDTRTREQRMAKIHEKNKAFKARLREALK